VLEKTFIKKKARFFHNPGLSIPVVFLSTALVHPNPPPNFSQVDFSIFQHYFSCRLKPMASEEALLDQFL
jgi:hypothetical protein